MLAEFYFIRTTFVFGFSIVVERGGGWGPCFIFPISLPTWSKTKLYKDWQEREETERHRTYNYHWNSRKSQEIWVIENFYKPVTTVFNLHSETLLNQIGEGFYSSDTWVHWKNGRFWWKKRNRKFTVFSYVSSLLSSDPNNPSTVLNRNCFYHKTREPGSTVRTSTEIFNTLYLTFIGVSNRSESHHIHVKSGKRTIGVRHNCGRTQWSLSLTVSRRDWW